MTKDEIKSLSDKLAEMLKDVKIPEQDKAVFDGIDALLDKYQGSAVEFVQVMCAALFNLADGKLSASDKKPFAGMIMGVLATFVIENKIAKPVNQDDDVLLKNQPIHTC